jgi:hypothetical protein
MTDTTLSPFDLLDLPRLQREIVIYLSRAGPTDADTLALRLSSGQALAWDPSEVRDALSSLVEKGHVRLLADGRAKVGFGRTRRRTLPAQLWPALLAPSRLYSKQEIATLRTAVPILLFARAKLGEMVDHGPGQALRVKSFTTQLGYVLGLTPAERHLLRAAALFHDVGNVVDRSRHNVISQETVEKLTAAGSLPFSPSEAKLIGLLCRWHRKDYDPERRDVLHGEPIRTGLLASILRVADAMDIDHRRSDYADQFAPVIRFFYPDQLPHWAGAENVLGVRIRCAPAMTLQVFAQGRIEDNIQIAMLDEDLEGTPLDCSIQVIAVNDHLPASPSVIPGQPCGIVPIPQGQPALIAFPFDPHSLVMAALSRQHLIAAGYAVELLCYPDTAGGSTWLWRDALPNTAPTAFARLVVIGDRPDPTIDADILRTVSQWREADVRITILNRHEANWSRLPDLLQLEVEVILGGDWAYFWGDAVTQSDLAWGRIASLCTRDPTQSTVGLTNEEQAVTRGLLKAAYDALRQPAEDTTGWAALAESIMDRIAADDRAYFAAQAQDFAATYAEAIASSRIEGRVLIFEPQPGVLPQGLYWAMEAAIERRGRSLESGVRFDVPYAIASWPDGDAVELLAINHWLEEEAVPIRLLYPSDLGPPPEGHESAIRVRLPADQAQAVVNALVTACNRP